MSKLILKLSGGLGNQLFQLGAARYAHSRLGIPVSVDISFYSPANQLLTSLQKLDRREFEIETLFDYRTLLTKTFLPRVFLRSKAGVVRISDTKVFDASLPGELLRSRLILLEGYFQEIAAASTLIKDMRALLPSGSKDSQPQSTGLHIRLGDFRRIQGGERLATMDYYKNAIELEIEKAPGAGIVLYSDQPAHAIKMLEQEFGKLPKEIALAKKSTSPLEVMISLASHRRRVLSASTFSWWASYMAEALETDTFPEAFRENKRLFPTN